MKKVIHFASVVFFLLNFLHVGLSQLYNPKLEILTLEASIKSKGYVDYTTISDSPNDGRFTLYGDGYFGTQNDFGHQFPKNEEGYTTTTFFNRRYKHTSPTRKLKSTGQTGSGGGVNNRISMPSGANIKIATSWLPCNDIENYFMLIFENTTSGSDAGCVEFFYHDTELDLNAAGILEYDWVNGRTISNVTGSTQYNKKIRWYFNNLLLGEQRIVYIPMTSKVSVGAAISVGSKYKSGCLNGGSSISNATFHSAGSPHDPNSKVADVECISEGVPESQTITYTIKFQNGGDGFARNVVLKDELDATKLDLNTIEFVDSEYSYTYSLQGNELQITFPNIYLPGSKQPNPKIYSYDDTESYIQFKICARSSLSEGVIENDVAIYFDNQPPVYTNVSEVFIFDSCNSNSPECSVNYKLTNTIESIPFDIEVTPNPVNDLLYFEGIDDKDFVLNIYNNRGELVKAKFSINKQNNSIDLTYLPTGMYFVKLENEKNTITKKVIKL